MKKNLQTLILTSIITVVTTVTATPVFCQLKFSAIPNTTTIALDQALQIEFVLEGVEKMESFIPPRLDGFTIIQGPQYSNSLSIVNGNVSHSVGVGYVLLPQKCGKIFIGPAQAQVNGKVIKTESICISVLNKTSGNSTPGNTTHLPFISGTNTANDNELSDYVLKKGEDPIAKIQKNLVLKLGVSKKSCYEGEPIVATYKLYTRLKSSSKVTKRPSFNGFSVAEMTTPESMDFQTDQLNGRPFYSTVLRKVQLFPLHAGEITLEPVEVASLVRFLKNKEVPASTHNSFDNIFRDFFEDNILTGETEEHKLTQQTKAVTISVKPLPEADKPINFNGAVGKFTIQTVLKNSAISINETGTLKVIIQGKGNLSMINAPVIDWPEGIESFEPSSSENIDNLSVPLSGTKTFEYPFTVVEKGNYTIPAVSISYFNPEKRVYEMASTNPLTLVVNNSVANKTGNKSKDPVAKNVNLVSDENNISKSLMNTRWWLVLVFIALLWGGYKWYQYRGVTKRRISLKQKIISQEEQIPITDGVITTFNTGHPLDLARRELKKENATGFYTELHAGLWRFIQEKYQLSPADMNKKVVAEKLKADFFDEKMINDFQQLLDKCEIALYTPTQFKEERYQLLQQAETFIKTVEYKIV